MKKYSVIDIFAGVGGLSYGFHKSDKFNILAANEIDKDIAKSYELNHPDVPVYNCDIKDLNVKQILKENNIERIDVLIGGPPCQSFSTIGNRIMDDRAKLFKEYHRILKESNPKIFIFENVVGLLSMDKGKLFKKIIKLFEQTGYNIQYKVLNAVEYGVPQERKRVFIVGTKQDYKFSFPKKTHSETEESLLSFITLKEALSDLPPLNPGEEGYSYKSKPNNCFQKKMRECAGELLTEHASPKNNPKLIKIMKLLPDGGTKKDLPEELRPKSGYGNTYSKLWWNKPSTTVTRNFAVPSSSRCIHPRDSRALSTREGARIQSFPDHYQFYGSRSKKNLQIGNAVPPLLSEALMGSVLKGLEEH